MNPGEVWRVDDGSLRLVLSNATYNSSALNRVISAVVGPASDGFDPFAVETPAGNVYADRIAMHPRNWLIAPLARLDADAMAAVRGHLDFLLGP